MDFSMGTLLWGMLFGSIGGGYLLYGKKMSEGSFIFTGLALCVYPYFFDSTLAIVLIGIGLSLYPFVSRRL